MSVPKSVAVLGSGPGGLAIAADCASHGSAVTLADLPEFSENLDAVQANEGVTVVSGLDGERTAPVNVAASLAAAVDGAEMVIVSVKATAHEHIVQEATPSLGRQTALLFMGEGGGALIARRALPPDQLIGETNALPFHAKLAGPGRVSAERKRGGVFLAAIPCARTGELLALVADVWPPLEPASSVWETVLLNYDAIDTVPVALANAGALEGRRGGYLLWGEGATPGVVNLISAVDAEISSLRRELGSTDSRGYRDLLIAQGMASEGNSLEQELASSALARSVRPSGSPESLARILDADLRFSLVFAQSLGDAVGIQTPVIDAIVGLGSALLNRDLHNEGRTLARIGLEGRDARALRSWVGL